MPKIRSISVRECDEEYIAKVDEMCKTYDITFSRVTIKAIKSYVDDSIDPLKIKNKIENDQQFKEQLINIIRPYLNNEA